MKKIMEGYDLFYEEKVSHWDDWTESNLENPRKWVATIAKKQKGKCLIVGCGITDLKFLQDDVQSTVGIDISKKALTTAKDYGVVALSDSNHLPFRHSVFDKVCVLDVLEHIPTKKKTVREIKKTLKTGGKIFLSTPIKNRDTSGDERQPFDEPPTLYSLIHLITENFRLSKIKEFGKLYLMQKLGIIIPELYLNLI